jgi:hypothetical protein
MRWLRQVVQRRHDRQPCGLAVLGLQSRGCSVKSQPDSEITVDELAALCDALDLMPGYSMSTQRAFVRTDGEVLWAKLDGTLPQNVPGMWRLQNARTTVWFDAVREQQAEFVASLSPEERARYDAWAAKFHNMPDPMDWQMDLARERSDR